MQSLMSLIQVNLIIVVIFTFIGPSKEGKMGGGNNFSKKIVLQLSMLLTVIMIYFDDYFIEIEISHLNCLKLS